MKFIHTAPTRAGFYRNPESALAEALVIKQNAANGPKRPTESPKEARDRMDKAAIDKKSRQQSL